MGSSRLPSLCAEGQALPGRDLELAGTEAREVLLCFRRLETGEILGPPVAMPARPVSSRGARPLPDGTLALSSGRHRLQILPGKGRPPREILLEIPSPHPPDNPCRSLPEGWRRSNMSGWIIAGLIGIAIALAGFALSRAILRVPALRVAVIRDPHLHTVRRLIHGPRTAFLLPGPEEVWGWMDTAPRALRGQITGVDSADGLPLDVEWRVIFRLDPEAIPPANRPAALRALLYHPEELLRLHLEDLLRARFGEETAAALTAGRQREILAERVRAGLARRLQDQGIEVGRVMLGAIRLPEESRKSRILREALGQLTREDLQRLAHVHILGLKGDS